MIEEMIAFAGRHWGETGTIIVVVILYLIDKSDKIKFNPLKRFFGAIGKLMMNSVLVDLKSDISKISDELTTTQKKLDELEKQNQLDKDEARKQRAMDQRGMIRRFASQLRNNNTAKISQNEFDDIFEIIDEYEETCEKYKIRNNVIGEDKILIHTVYRVQFGGGVKHAANT